MTIPEDWAPQVCTLPTARRPLRVAEFDEFFTAVLRFERAKATRLDLVIPRELESAGRDLATRESKCCSFFEFDFETVGDELVIHIGVPRTQLEVLDAIAARLAR